MKQRPRRCFTQTEMAEVWDRWEQSESLNAIARDLGRYHSALQGKARLRGPAAYVLQRSGDRSSH